MSRYSVLQEIQLEREAQVEKAHGGDTDEFDTTNSRNDWITYICHYACRGANKIFSKEPYDFRKAMIKVAALAIAAIEAHDNEYC